MENKLKRVLDQVTAEEELKNRTREFLREERNRSGISPWRSLPRLIPAVACMVLLVVWGYWLYFVPTATISIDINPSLELELNRFDRVVGLRGYGDGEDLAQTLSVTHLDYDQAMEQIMQSQPIADLLAQDAVMTVGVIGRDNAQTARLLVSVEFHAAQQENTYCYQAHREEVEHAHELGMSYGKYYALLELETLGAEVTAEDVQNMTMGEIWEMKEHCENHDEQEATEESCQTESEHQSHSGNSGEHGHSGHGG